MKNHTDHEFLLSFSDLLLICRKDKHKIFFGMILCAFLASLYTLSKPIEYNVEATFKEKGKSQSGLNKSLSALFFSGVGESDSEAISLMKSRKLMEQLVKKMNLQASVIKKEQPSSSLLKSIKENLIVEYALFKKRKEPALPDPYFALEAREISFSDEVPLSLEIHFRSDHEFDVLDHRQLLVGQGVLNQPFSTDRYQFTLINKDDPPLKTDVYFLNLSPLVPVADNLAKILAIESDRLDKGLLKLSYKHRYRHHAANLLNELMSLYQNHLQNEHQRIANIQLSYLEKRQNEMRNQLQDLMFSHAKMLSTDVTNTGFATIDKAMDFLASNQAIYKQKLMSLELEIQRLINAQEQGESFFDKFALKESSSPINLLSSEIRNFKQQADSLDLALRTDTPVDSKSLQEAFITQLNQLEEIKECKQDAQLILARIENDDFKSAPAKLVENPKFMVKTWYSQLRRASTKEELNNCKDSFMAYLTNLIHLFDVHQRSIEERLAHQQVPQEEFQGINLSIAQELYLEYSRAINDLQAKIIQDQFILHQIDDPEFELTSLSTVLNDPVSTQMITKSSGLILAIKDKHNRTSSEVERMKSELAIQKGFLSTHLAQTIQLLDLHMNHLKGKVHKIQNTLLTLIQEQITILQNHIAEYINDQLDILKLEKSLIENSIEEIRQDMVHLPEKWAHEKLIDQQMDLNQKMIEELIKLVESKNINNNLEMIQSAPMDLAIPPIHPKPSRLLLFAVLGTILGGILSVGGLLIRSIVTGIQATAENLRLAGQQVAGSLAQVYSDTSSEPMLDNDLSTLRRLSAFLEQPHVEGFQKALLLIRGQGLDYSHNLAELLSKKGLKVLLLPLSFDSQDDYPDLPGLLQYLEGTEEPKILKGNGYDFIAAGGFCRFSNELIGSRRFQDLLKAMLKQYDWVIGVTHASPTSAEADSLMEYFPYAAVTITDQTLNQIKNYIHQSNRKIIFVMQNES